MYGGLSGLAVSNGVEGPASGAAPVAVGAWAAVSDVWAWRVCMLAVRRCVCLWVLEDAASFKTHPSLMSESSPALSYGKFGDLE